jgi:toxin FitB
LSGGLLDTSVVISTLTAGLTALPPTAAISVITLGELHAGVLLARDDLTRSARRERLKVVRAAFSPLAVDEPVSERYGEVVATARSQGRTVKATDLLIIATALATGRTLFTQDQRQFQLARAVGAAVTVL